jgi:hypothetical protein
MTPTLITAARAALDALGNLIDAQNGPPLVRHAASWLCAMNGASAAMQALRAAIEAAEKAEPVAYRVEIRWRDRALDQSWRKYADTAYRDRAISLRDSENNMETESRIVPLYAGKPEEPR